MMKDIINSLPEQIESAFDLVPKFSSRRRFNRILICGMGGSGISGELCAGLFPRLPIISNKDYSIPDYVDKKTLVILISYSGNTEETLNNLKIAFNKGCEKVIISSDGKLLQARCQYKVKIPPGLPPRGALGYLFTPLPLLLHNFGLIPGSPLPTLNRLVKFLKDRRRMLEKKARMLAPELKNRMPILYANSKLFFSVANRWRCQFNENSKILAHINIIPEMNHNEIVGLGGPVNMNRYLFIILLNDPNAHPRNRLRMKIIKEIIKPIISQYVEIKPQGKNNLEQTFETIMLGDFLSYYLAEITGVDPMPVKRIDYLKRRLAEYKKRP